MLTSIDLFHLCQCFLAPICTDYGRGGLYAQFSATPNTWTKRTLSYTANYTNPVLYFAIETDTNNYHYLDDISVVDVASPTVELLDNPSFDNATVLAGWDQWCTSTCILSGNGAPGQIVSGFTCRSSPYKCLQVECDGPTSIYMISQTFSAILGRTYTISFWHIHSGSSSGNELYVDIF